MRLFTVFLASTIALVAGTRGAVAQQALAQLAIGGGAATDVRGLRSDAVTAAPALALLWPRGLLRLGATGTSFSTGGWALGAGASGRLRSPLAATPLAFTVDAAANTAVTSYHQSYSTVGATPAVEFGFSRLTLFAGVQTTQAWTALGRAALPGPVSSSSSMVVRRAIGPVFGGQLAVLASRSGNRLSLGYREERTRIDDVPVTDRTGTIALIHGPVAISGMLGIRRAPDEATTFSGIATTIALSRIIALQVGAERYAGNRLTGALGGRSLNAGLVLRTPTGPHPAPRPRGVPAPRRGVTRLAIRAPDATTVTVAGDWTGWQPVAATRAPNGVWYADQVIPPGEYRYAFRIDGKEWRVPDGVVATDDGIGGKSAWLTVSRTAE